MRSKCDASRQNLEAPNSNLLKALRSSDLSLLLPELEPIELHSKQVLYEPGDDVGFVYFPCDSTLLSFIVSLDDAKDVEIALVGREGAIGGIVSRGQVPAFARTVVQIGGLALRLRCSKLESAKLQSEALCSIFSRYADCLLAQIFQSVACNAAHTIEQRTAKWLIAAMDHTGGPILPVTQEQLARTLGVGRSYVARVIAKFKSRGLIQVQRRQLRVLKQEALSNASCDCNSFVRRHFEEMLGGVYPADEASSSSR
jgi:CRP-like cAMP-binding protein